MPGGMVLRRHDQITTFVSTTEDSVSSIDELPSAPSFQLSPLVAHSLLIHLVGVYSALAVEVDVLKVCLY